jgi:two-component system, OmpR family, sensor histidine kinase BaeS
MDWLRSSLARKLFLSYLLVIVVGIITLFLVSEAIAPRFLDHSMAGMMGQSGTGMMGGYTDTALRAAFRTAMVQSLLVAGGSAALVAIVASVFISRQIAHPIHRMVGATHRIASGQYGERVPAELDGKGDEIASLATSFNEMAASLQQTEARRLALVGDVAHEMRTPLATLQGNLEGVLDGVVEASPATWAMLHDEVGRLRRLIDDLQELSRAEARQIPLSIQAVPPAAIVQSAVDRLGGQFEEKGLTLQVTIPANLPTVQADRDRSVQVLTNLLTNALRYTPVPGRVEVTVTQHADVVTFTVSDTGVGLAPEHRAHLFERFYRVDKSRSRALGGSGIGLTIAKALVEAMAGKMHADSPGVGRGSTFTFSLPIVSQ